LIRCNNVLYIREVLGDDEIKKETGEDEVDSKFED
jgi:hypothetical protein